MADPKSTTAAPGTMMPANTVVQRKLKVVHLTHSRDPRTMVMEFVAVLDDGTMWMNTTGEGADWLQIQGPPGT